MGTQRRYHAYGGSYAWLVRSTAFINFFYFYCVDEDRSSSSSAPTSFPFTAKLYPLTEQGCGSFQFSGRVEVAPVYGR